MLDRINPIKRQINVGIDENHIEPFSVVSGDLDGNKLELTIVQDEYTVLDLTGYTVDIVFENIKKQTYSQDCIIKNATGGVVTVTLAADVISVPGTVKAELRILEGTAVKTTTGFSFVVKKSLVDTETVVPKNQLPSYKNDLQNLRNETNTNLNNAKDELNTKIDTNSDRINNIVANTGNSNTEIVDARMDSVGKVYPTLGGHVRNLDKELSNIQNDKLSTVTKEENVFSLPNCQDGQLNFSLKGRTLKNEVNTQGTNIFRQTSSPQTVRKLINLNLKANTVYTLKIKIENYSGTANLKITDYTDLDSIKGLDNNSINNNGIYTIKVQSSTDIKEIWIYFGASVDGICDTSNIMILEGDWADKQVLQYFEGIKSCGESEDKIEVLTRNKNIFDDTFERTDGYYRSYIDGNFTPSQDLSHNCAIVKIVPNKTFTISSDGNFSNFVFLDKDKKFISGIAKAYTFTIPLNTAYFTFALDKNYTWCQIELGSKATDYVKGKSDKIDILFTNLFGKWSSIDKYGNIIYATGKRVYKVGDEDSPDFITDKINTYYELPDSEKIKEKLPQPLILQSFYDGSMVIDSIVPPETTVTYPISIAGSIQTNSGTIKILNDFIKQQNIINIRLDSRITALEP